MSPPTTESAARTTLSTPAGAAPSLDWGLIQRQIAGIFRLEVRRTLLGRRAAALYILALFPVPFFAVWAMTPAPQEFFGDNPTGAVQLFSGFFATYLRTSVFLSTLILFMSLFRSEILQKSLHYYLLTPVRREVLTVGKYLSALIAVCAVFAGATAVSYLTTFSGWGLGELSRFLFQGPGLGHLVTYVGISVLACIGYGAVFLLMGLFFRNPVFAAVLIWGWEFINWLLPPLLKKFSVIFYLQSLYPVPLDARFFTVIADPIPAWISVPGLLLFTAFVLAIASWRARQMEVSYGVD